jgi:hypothetical protein
MRNIVHPISLERIMALVDRAKNTLLSPRSELQVIDAEPATVNSLYAGYIAPLVAIAAICRALGMSLIGYSFFGTHYRTPIGTALIGAVIMIVVSLVMVYVAAFIIDALAPTFSGTKNMVKALQVVAFMATPVWVLGILTLIPAIGTLISIVGLLYGLYLLYLALPVLMKSPVDKAPGYTVVVIIACFIVGLLIGMVVGALGFSMVGGMGAAGYHP